MLSMNIIIHIFSNFQNKCISYKEFSSKRKGSWLDAQYECNKLGQDLVMPKSPDELRTLMTLIRIGNKGRCAYVGLQKKWLKINPVRSDVR